MSIETTTPTNDPQPPESASAIPAEQTPKGRLVEAKEWVEFLSKVIPLVAGTIYIAGYIVTARRLADYGVSVTQLLNAQYFTAGTAPGLMIWLTVAVAYSALTYDFNRNKGVAKSRVAWTVTVLSLITMAFSFLNYLTERFWSVRVVIKWPWLESYVLIPILAILGFTSLWYVIVYFKGVRRTTPNSRQRSDPLQGSVIPLVLGLSSLVFTYWQSTRIYEAIPQAYGGGKPLNVRLYIERDKTPTELIAVDAENAEKPLVYSVPLQLVFQTSDSLIVSAGDKTRVWTLDAHSVHAVRYNP